MSVSDARVQRSGGSSAHECRFDDHRVVGVHEADAIGDAQHVAIDRQPRHAERVAEHDVGGLASDAGQSDERVHVGGHLAAVFARRARCAMPTRLRDFIRKNPVGTICGSSSSGVGLRERAARRDSARRAPA